MRRLAVLAAMVSAFACGGSSNTPTFSANLAHGNEPNQTGFNAPAPNATGTAAFQLVGTTLTYSLRATGLSSAPNNAHIHLTPAASTPTAPLQGPIVLPLKFVNTGATVAANSVTVDDIATGANIPAGTKDPDDATKLLTFDRLVQLIQGGRTYVNIHTVNNPSGEVRGDLH